MNPKLYVMVIGALFSYGVSTLTVLVWPGLDESIPIQIWSSTQIVWCIFIGCYMHYFQRMALSSQIHTESSQPKKSKSTKRNQKRSVQADLPQVVHINDDLVLHVNIVSTDIVQDKEHVDNGDYRSHLKLFGILTCSAGGSQIVYGFVLIMYFRYWFPNITPLYCMMLTFELFIGGTISIVLLGSCCFILCVSVSSCEDKDDDICKDILNDAKPVVPKFSTPVAIEGQYPEFTADYNTKVQPKSNINVADLQTNTLQLPHNSCELCERRCLTPSPRHRDVICDPYNRPDSRRFSRRMDGTQTLPNIRSLPPLKARNVARDISLSTYTPRSSHWPPLSDWDNRGQGRVLGQL
jgi:hypothetical protein